MPSLETIAFVLIVLNLLSFVLFGVDKLLSKSVKARRVPEKTLLIASALAASPGALLAMVLFNHKTSKPRFRYGMPLLLTAHAAIGYWMSYS
ncbi:DUF1294 domain-containing protein [Pelagicoccus sp. SDUM812003]|uniref:DUF1294 domain-containing protein n=1 Tax=Pelagicoccus sp. SDUM812003 TaxID=3041267 RepID=UPI00280DFB16|nr:DUF1294 domain-containing protein [Pelagicoccus sp. SDUM812003]MDQ8205142.1 DUF1294 domain-containing protein [Pelagicoccus sp. SDUM812003]